MDLISRCALRVAKLEWQPGQGRSAVTVVCKATFELRPSSSPLAAVQDAVVERDVYARPDRSSLAQASELVPFKQRPEVLLTGHAYAPGGTRVPSLVARLVVGEIDKSIQVEGNRWFDLDGWISEPEPFDRLPLVWERSAGGPGTENPAGLALDAGVRPDKLGRVPAPNLMPPGLFLTSRRKVVPPRGFGPIAPRWRTRAAHLGQHVAGWDPDQWSDRLLPADIGAGYFNAAPSDQQRAEPFGEESIYLENLHPSIAKLSTRLASVVPVATVERDSGAEALRLRCDTLIIDADRGLASLVWRANALVDHADPPRRVIVTGPGAAEPAPRPAVFDTEETTSTLLHVIAPDVSRAALPFSASPHQPSAPPPASPPPTAPQPSAPERILPTKTTLGPSEVALLAPALPFSPGPRPRQATVEQAWPSAPVLPFSAGTPEPSPPQPIQPQPTQPQRPPTATAMLNMSDFAAIAPVLPFSLGTPALRSVGEHGEDPSGSAVPAAASEAPRPPAPMFMLGSAPPREPEPDTAPRAPVFYEQTQDAWSPTPPGPSWSPTPSEPLVPAPASEEPRPPAPVFMLDNTPPPQPVADVATYAPVFVVASEAHPAESDAPGPDPDIRRIQLVQQAIWKGDKPIRQILAAHGLTEIEWRAMKRASAKKISA